VVAPAARLLIRFETTERAADLMAGTTRTLLDQHGASTDIVSGERERDLWNQHESSIWAEPGLVAKVSVLPTDVEAVLAMTAGAHANGDWSAIGRAALGLLLVRVNADNTWREFLIQLRQKVAEKRGSLSVLRGGMSVAPLSQSDAPLRAVMNAVKARFDPTGVLPELP